MTPQYCIFSLFTSASAGMLSCDRGQHDLVELLAGCSTRRDAVRAHRMTSHFSCARAIPFQSWTTVHPGQSSSTVQWVSARHLSLQKSIWFAARIVTAEAGVKYKRKKYRARQLFLLY